MAATQNAAQEPLKKLHEPSSTKDTPVKKRPYISKTAPQRSSHQSSNLKLEVQTLGNFHDLPNLVETYLGRLDEGKLNDCKSKLVDANLVTFKGSKATYPGINAASSKRERDLYQPFCELLNEIQGFCSPSTGSHNILWEDTHGPGEIDLKTNLPDISLVFRDSEEVPKDKAKKDKAKIKAIDIAVPGEIKPPHRGLSPEQVVKQCTEVFAAQPNRHTLYHLAIRYPNVIVYRMDRASIFQSKKFNMEVDCLGFINVVAQLGLLSGEEAGKCIYPGTIPIGRPLYGPTLSVRTEQLRIIEPIAQVTNSFGRCTGVWRVEHLVAPNATPMVLKVSWQDRNRTPEAFFYSMAEQAGVEGLPEIYKAETLGTISSFRSPNHRNQPPFEDREQRRLIMKTEGVPLHDSDSIVEVLTAIRDCIKCHKDLYNKAHILHRDISCNNVLLQRRGASPKVTPESSDMTGDIPEKADNQIRGLLIDLEYAKKVERIETGQDIQDPPIGAGAAQDDKKLHGRTGTLPFMASALLDVSPPRHDAEHDLESFFYVLLYMAIDGPLYQPGSDWEQAGGSRHIRLFTAGDMDAILEARVGLWSSYLRDRVHLADQWISFMLYMRQAILLFRNSFERHLDTGVLHPGPEHDKFIDILEKALGDPIIQQAPRLVKTRPQGLQTLQQTKRKSMGTSGTSRSSASMPPPPVPEVSSRSLRSSTGKDVSVARSSSSSSSAMSNLSTSSAKRQSDESQGDTSKRKKQKTHDNE